MVSYTRRSIPIYQVSKSIVKIVSGKERLLSLHPSYNTYFGNMSTIGKYIFYNGQPIHDER